MTRAGGCLARFAIVFVAFIVALALASAFLPPVRTITRTALLTYDLVGLPASPLQVLTNEPQRTTTSYGQPADRLDVYVPADAAPDRRLPGVVLELGVHPLPIDDPKVAALAGAIARLGMVVGVPDSSALRETRLEPTESAHLADAVLVLARLPEVDPARVGLAGFSAGGSIALIAAADRRIADDLRYVAAFGAYADAATLLVDVASASQALDGEAVAWQPDPGIVDDVDALVTYWDPYLAQQLFVSRDRAAAQALIDALPLDQRALLDALSPIRFVSGIRAPVHLLHGRADAAIPYSHALALVAALGPRAELTTFGRFGHEHPGQTGLSLDDAGDVWALSLYLRGLVAAAAE